METHLCNAEETSIAVPPWAEGSSINIIFRPPKWDVVVGFSKKSWQYKLPCGKVEGDDITPDLCGPADAIVVARNCAIRELYREALIKEKELLYFAPMDYVRTVTKKETGKKYSQWHFFGIVRPEYVLTGNPIEKDEMGDPEYWDILKVLDWNVTEEYKMNPFHRIAVASALIEMQSAGAEDEKSFSELLHRISYSTIAGKRVHIDTYILGVWDLIRRRDPRA